MSGPRMFETGIGRKFYGTDVPRIARALERIATALEKLVARQGGADAHPETDEHRAGCVECQTAHDAKEGA